MVFCKGKKIFATKEENNNYFVYIILNFKFSSFILY